MNNLETLATSRPPSEICQRHGSIVDYMAGALTQEDASAFEKGLRSQRRIDSELLRAVRVSQRSLTLAITLAFAFIAGFPSPTRAWDDATFQALVEDAIQLAPGELKAFLDKHQDNILGGVEFPHRYQLRTMDGPHHAHDPFQHAALLLQKERSALKEEWKKPKPNEIWIAGRMGVMAHYIGDIVRPQRFLPTDPYVRTRLMFPHYHTFVYYEGPRLIEDFPLQVKHWRQWILSLENRENLDTMVYHAAVNAVLNAWLTVWKDGGRPLTGTLSVGKLIHHKKLDVHLRHLTPAEQRELNYMRAGLEEEKGIETLKKLDPKREEADRRIREAYSPQYSVEQFTKRLEDRRNINSKRDKIVADTKESIYKELDNPITYHKDYNITSEPSIKPGVYFLEFSLKAVGGSLKGAGRLLNYTQQTVGMAEINVALYDKEGRAVKQFEVPILTETLGPNQIKSFSFDLSAHPFKAYTVRLKVPQ